MSSDVTAILTALEALTGELSLAVGGNRQTIVAPRPDREQALAAATLITQCRKRRARFHPDYFFGEPCWDMLLDLFVAKERGKPMTVTNLCSSSQVPYGTALRYIGRLEERGDILRTADTNDHRRCFVSITEAAGDRMIACLNDMKECSQQQGFAA